MLHQKTSIFIAIFLLLPSLAAHAQERKTENFRFFDGKTIKTIKGQAILGTLSDKDISFSGVVLEKSTLDEVTNKFGSANALETGDAGDFNRSVCYLAKDGTVITFNSGEMGGGKIIDLIEIFNRKQSIPTNCVKPEKEVPTSNDAGIKLGLSRSKIVEKFGVPSYQIGENEIDYDFESKIDNSKCEGGFDVGESYKFKFDNNQLIYFSVSKVTSC